ncbi:MAG TPA: heparinase II/III family protein [Mycobacteriales bacterium]|nr:heparinase II/III family protein [Mycobacteriales bacterium]
MNLSRYNVREIERILRQADPGPAFPPVTDRAGWDEISTAVPQRRDQILQNARQWAGEPVPALPATLYLEFLRTGRREGYQEPMRQRRQMLADLVLAECFEGTGEFLDPVLDVLWATCEESSWAYPAHQRDLTDLDHPVIDLGAAMTALGLAEAIALLGDVLDPLLSKRIRDEIDRRCLVPYLTRHDHHWLHSTGDRPVNNWTAVCTGGVLGAAIHLEADPARLAEILARGLHSLDDYLAGFDADGGSSEGPGYWSYGFGYYTLLAQLIEHRTGGHIAPLSGPRIEKIARFPLSTQLGPGQYVPFSDCNPQAQFSVPQLSFLAARLDIPELAALAADQRGGGRDGELQWALRGLLWRSEPPYRFVPAAHDWFSGMMWMFSRIDPTDPEALTVAVKGGHNGELHNQNDVGSFVLHVGGESVIAELGAGRYTKSYFGPQRYEHPANSSLGHSVPVPAGQAQVPGADHAATLLEHSHSPEQDRLRFELSGAYGPEAQLEYLERSITVLRTAPGSVQVVDRVRFGSPQSFSSVLITFGDVQQDSGSVQITGERGSVRVRFDPAVVSCAVETWAAVDLTGGPRDVHRIAFSIPEPAKESTVALRIDPK